MAFVTQPQRLGDLVQSIFSGLEPARRRSSADVEGTPEHRTISVGDLDDGFVPALEDLPRRAFHLLSGDEVYRARVDDLLVAARGTQFKIGWVREDSAGAIVTSTLIVLRPQRRLLTPLLFALLQSQTTQDELRTRVRRSTSTLSWATKDYSELRILMPPDDVSLELSRLVDLGEQHYGAAMRAARLRRAIIHSALQDRGRSNREGAIR